MTLTADERNPSSCCDVIICPSSCLRTAGLSDSEDEDADQVTAVPNLPHISTQRDINVTDTVTATGTVTGR